MLVSDTGGVRKTATAGSYTGIEDSVNTLVPRPDRTFMRDTDAADGGCDLGSLYALAGGRGVSNVKKRIGKGLKVDGRREEWRKEEWFGQRWVEIERVGKKRSRETRAVERHDTTPPAL